MVQLWGLILVTAVDKGSCRKAVLVALKSGCHMCCRQWPGLIYGLVAILAFTPCLGFAAKRLNLTPPEFNIGLAIFCVVPTTLGKSQLGPSSSCPILLNST